MCVCVYYDRGTWWERSVASVMKARSTCRSSMSSDVFAASVWGTLRSATVRRTTGRRSALHCHSTIHTTNGPLFWTPRVTAGTRTLRSINPIIYHLRCSQIFHKHSQPSQGRRHGFESGGDNFASGASQKIFLTPHFLASGGTKYCVDS